MRVWFEFKCMRMASSQNPCGTAMNFRVPKRKRLFLRTKRLPAFEVNSDA
jgi:hypothetical protein